MSKLVPARASQVVRMAFRKPLPGASAMPETRRGKIDSALGSEKT